MAAASNARWVSSIQMARIAIHFVGLVIFARMLSPDDFGVMAVGVAAMNLAILVRDLGTSAAVIQSNQMTKGLRDTVFTLNIVTGTVATVVLFGSADLMAEAFAEPRLANVLRILSIAVALASLTGVLQALLERESRFRTVARIEITALVTGLFSAIVAIYFGLGVNGLAIQFAVTAGVSAVQFWSIKELRQGITLTLSEWTRIRKFGGQLTAFSFTNYLARNSDNVIVGQSLGALQLGYYSQAYRVMMLPLQAMTSVASRALFPVLSREQADPDAIGRLFFRCVSLIAYVSAPLMAGLWFYREPVIDLVLGTQWRRVAELLFWLAPVGFIQSVVSATGSVFMAAGRTDTLLKLGLIGAILHVTAFVAGSSVSIEAVAALYLLANLINFFPCFIATARQLNVPLRRILACFISPAIYSSVMLVVLHVLHHSFYVSSWLPWQQLLFGVPLGGAVIASLVWRFSPEVLADARVLVGVRQSFR